MFRLDLKYGINMKEAKRLCPSSRLLLLFFWVSVSEVADVLSCLGVELFEDAQKLMAILDERPLGCYTIL